MIHKVKNAYLSEGSTAGVGRSFFLMPFITLLIGWDRTNTAFQEDRFTQKTP